MSEPPGPDRPRDAGTHDGRADAFSSPPPAAWASSSVAPPIASSAPPSPVERVGDPPWHRAPDEGAPPSTSTAAPGPAPDEAVWAGGRCAVHPDAPAGFSCDRCGTFGCAACCFGGLPAPGVARARVCAACAASGLDAPIPWERRAELGWWRAFVDTTRLASTEPTRFFRTPSIERGIVGPVVYGVLANVVGQFFAVLGLGLSILAGGALTATLADGTVGALLGGYGCVLVGLSPIMALQAPIQALFGLAIATAGTHGTLVLGRRARGSFEDTLRLMAYASAPGVGSGLPICGAPIAYVWSLVVEFRAVREAHRVGADAAAIAVLGYRALILVGIVALYAAFALALVLWLPGPPGPGAR